MPSRDEITRVGKEREESIGELFNELASQSAGLVRDEVALAKQEVSEKIASYRTSAILIAIGALIGIIALLNLCAALTIGLGNRFGMWQAALGVGVSLALIAGVIIFYALSRLSQTSLKPELTIESLEEDKKWLKEIT